MIRLRMVPVKLNRLRPRTIATQSASEGRNPTRSQEIPFFIHFPPCDLIVRPILGRRDLEH